MGPKSPVIFPTHQTLVFMILFLEKRRMEGGCHKGLRGSQWLGLEGLGSRLEGEVRTGIRVWTGFWASQGVKGWGPSQAACTTGQSPLLLFLIAWGLCH